MSRKCFCTDKEDRGQGEELINEKLLDTIQADRHLNLNSDYMAPSERSTTGVSKRQTNSAKDHDISSKDVLDQGHRYAGIEEVVGYIRESSIQEFFQISQENVDVKNYVSNERSRIYQKS